MLARLQQTPAAPWATRWLGGGFGGLLHLLRSSHLAHGRPAAPIGVEEQHERIGDDVDIDAWEGRPRPFCPTAAISRGRSATATPLG